MSGERLEILKMLSEGKINPEEAEMLLRALDEPSDTDEGPGTERSRPGKGKETFDRFTEIFSEVGREIENEVGKAFESVRWPNVGKIVDEVADQVASSVSDFTTGRKENNRERQAGEHQEWTFDANGIAKIDAKTVNGSISLKGTDRDRIVVRTWKAVHGRRSVTEDFAREVEVRAEQVGDELRIFADHPTPPGGVNVVIRYEIETPRALAVRLCTVQGNIKVYGIDGPVSAESVNGSVALESETGPIEAQTVNGKIRADIGRLVNAATFLTTNGSIEMHVGECEAPVTAMATNGSVKLTLPSDFSGRVDAETRNGRVHTDFPVAVARKARNRLEGVIGDGGDAVMKLRSMNGSIHLKQGPADRSSTDPNTD